MPDLAFFSLLAQRSCRIAQENMSQQVTVT